MRGRWVVLIGVALVGALAAGTFAALRLTGDRSRTPQQVADAYFAAWRKGSFGAMAGLVDGPPADFAAEHRDLSRHLEVVAVEFVPDPVRRTGPDAAVAGYEVVRTLAGGASWNFRSTLRLARRGGVWRVDWTPATLHPDLKSAGTWSAQQVRVPAVTFTDSGGRALPGGLLTPYVDDLFERYAGVLEDEDADEGADGTAVSIEVAEAGGKPRRVALVGGPKGRKVRTTVDRRVQAAAERAVASGPPAVLVALRPSTGEVLAVADRVGGETAFVGGYPPGSTFKTVTAAALMAAGAGPGTPADCPAGVVTAQRTITNDEGRALGATTLAGAYAASCNTTFAKLAVDRLDGGRLGDTARAFGFGVRLRPGPGATIGEFPEPGSGAELAEASFGQGRVLASPLLMATVAAAAADGTWRGPRMLARKDLKSVGAAPVAAHDVPGAPGLRAMMRAVVTEGTAAGGGLPGGTAGKTGTAEAAGATHAWFIGFKGDLAFAVLVPAGGSGPKAAVPVAARFLRG
ncbi:penicillin-binding transpeptidase domain-containing protein [Actinomadura parmotrematis]|uniref:Cell division protein FtsI n=1 Tax=Actinomadura parmotrematis TaxID=2864039 RepID=A0ABS7FKH9_9ACTN|nr:penicillin-binding transpeptidase domain-containing protein [Actinomadura parmotrematis]MBW8480860.1 hypothetical protein [Actinomadura parmotrematis]